MQTPGVFLGSSAQPFLSDRTLFDADQSSATVSFKFFLDGTLKTSKGGAADVTPSAQEWWAAGITAGIGNSYDIRCKSINSGPAFTAEAAVVGTYIQISATRTWTLTKTSNANIVATFQIVATGTTTPILAEADLTFTTEIIT